MQRTQHCWMIHVGSFAHSITCCCMLLRVVGSCSFSLKPVKILSQKLPTFLLVRDRRCVAQQCWISLHSRSNIVVLSPMQTDATLLDVTFCVRLHTLLHVVACCCAKFETGQTFQPTTPNISFVP